MRGKYRVVVKNKRLHYEFEIKRNITIIKGDSATGKTTLINMIRQFANLGNSSGVDLMCDVPCRTLEGADWKIILRNISGNILFIDEENTFIRSEEFASEIKESDNYFVIITRENLYNLPYSVEEIYGLHSSGKYQNTKQIYQQMYRIYTDTAQIPVEPQTIVVEDSNSGYEFFKSIAEEQKISCRSAGGKTKLYSVFDKALKLMKIYDDSKTFIVNSEIESVVADIKSILKKSVPYSEIFKLPDLLDKFINLYSGLLNEMQKPLDTAIQEARQRVFEELQDKKCHDKLADKYVNLFREISDKAMSCNNVATFIPDEDNCIPITDEEYFEDDIVGLFCAWLKKVYGEGTLEENLDFIANALGNKGKTSREVIRNYFLTDFIKDHIKTYQKRPIYWIFDSGKQNGFKALVYMHRWNADTIGNVRVEYLHRIQRVYEKEITRMQEIIDNSHDNKEISNASEIVRYKPEQMAHLLNSKENWLLHEFLTLALDQFIDELAAEITGQDIMCTGVK